MIDKTTACYMKKLDTGRHIIKYLWTADIMRLELEVKED